MEMNPYQSPHAPSEPSSSEKERNQRRVLFVSLGAVTLFVWFIAGVICIYAAEVVALLGFMPIGLLGAFTVWHGLKPSKSSVRSLLVTLVILVGEFVFLAIMLN